MSEEAINLSVGRRISVELTAEIAARLAGGRSCADLVTSGKLTQNQLDRARRIITAEWSKSYRLSDPVHHVALEYARLSAIDEAAMEAFEASRSEGRGDSSFLNVALKASESRRKLLGINAPERREVVISERPSELVDAILADFEDVSDG